MQNSQDSDIGSYFWLKVAIRAPMGGVFEYKSKEKILLGSRVIVPFGKRTVIGIVCSYLSKPSFELSQMKMVIEVLDDLPPFSSDWLRLIKFTSEYYQRSLGDVIYSVIPAPLRNISAYQGKKKVKLSPVVRANLKTTKYNVCSKESTYDLNNQQQEAINKIISLDNFRTVVLHGVTGSGKTEVYLNSAKSFLNTEKQILFLVPEINLTPQLENSVRSYFNNLIKQEEIVVIHSGLSIQERVKSWSKIQKSQARVVLGTRMAIFTPMNKLGLIVIDEEHDISYKQQNGLKYSARDIAIWRAKDLNIPIILGSATPSLETWNHVKNNHYLLISLDKRVKNIKMPVIRLVDTKSISCSSILTDELIEAIKVRMSKKEQSLIFINRRGYAPVFYCYACNWISNCPRCSVYTVIHSYSNNNYKLHCHHCGYHTHIPNICPSCGNQDLKTIGFGTQKIVETLFSIFPEARIVRIDSDTTKNKGSANLLLSAVHGGEVDILVGTQMVTKGHDFSMVSLVGVINSDSMLFSQDFRSPERLFSQLMQVSGRAGRHIDGSEVIIQTSFTDHIVYQSLIKHDYVGFADVLLEERKKTLLPPYVFQALLTAESKKIDISMSFLEKINFSIKNDILQQFKKRNQIICYEPLPARIVKLSNVERAQLLIESSSRSTLLSFLRLLISNISVNKISKIRWSLEVDPLEI
ncbi:MAG: primosomal protein N' [Candidatus Kinetoplastibacterium crithidii]|nr:MAG: primosomal protein N' [Candidatus Kinetoplastibacterium crithidii]